VLVSVLYLEGARAFRSLPARRWSVYAGGLVTIGAVAFFAYVVPSLNARAAAMSAYLAVLCLLTAISLLRAVPPGQVLGLRLTGIVFALCGATHVARAAYYTFGPRFDELLALSGVAGAFFVVIVAEMSLFPVGLLLAAHERMMADLKDATELAAKADAAVAQHRETEAILRESERRFRALSDASPVMIWVSGVDRLFTYVNRGWLEFTGRPIDAELGKGWTERLHPDDFAKYSETSGHAFDRRLPFRMEFRVRRHDGEYRWILASGAPNISSEGIFTGYVGSALDVTDLRLAREALSTLSGKLMAAQEQERDWIARELHEDLAQRAAALNVQLHNIARSLPHRTSERLGLQHTCDLAAGLATGIPLISHRLNSSKLEHLGLAPAAAALCRSLSERHGIEIELRHDEVPKNLSKNVALCLFRVLQEALNNAVKHAGVPRVTVALRGTSTEIHLSVEDRGVGFDPEATPRNQGLGIISMTERLNLVAGRIRIESRPGAGTTVHVRVPLRFELNVNAGQALM
jgi:PAS domain S-box-containing protein